MNNDKGDAVGKFCDGMLIAALLGSVMKVLGFITVSWWLALAPVWIPSIAIVVYLICSYCVGK